MSENDPIAARQENSAEPVAVGVIGLGVMGHAIATRLQQELGASPTATYDPRPLTTSSRRAQPSAGPPPKSLRTATSSSFP